MREICLYGSEGGEAVNPLSLPQSILPCGGFSRSAAPQRDRNRYLTRCPFLGALSRRALTVPSTD